MDGHVVEENCRQPRRKLFECSPTKTQKGKSFKYIRRNSSHPINTVKYHVN